MKAVILAGGEGTRLKDISMDLPKPMMPLLGRPVLEHIVAQLRLCGFDEVCMTLRYRPEVIRRHFGDGHDFGVRIEYRTEKQALGTAGSVKNCMDFVGGEPFLVIAGDCVCDFALNEAMQAHRGGVTIVVTHDDEPLRYGLVVTGRGSRVAGFLEKPSWERVVTDTVSTGIYVLSPEVMELVPAGQPFDFARDLFPALLERGTAMRALALDGYWCDIGTPHSYYQANLDVLDGRCRPALPTRPQRSVVPCRSRAALMAALAQAACEFGADWSDGLRISDEHGTAHAAPLGDRSAIVVEGEGEPCRRMLTLARRLADGQNAGAQQR